MKMRKLAKILAGMCVAVLVFTALAGCGGDEDTSTDTSSESSYTTDSTSEDVHISTFQFTTSQGGRPTLPLAGG